jgi:hypothetical protein
LTVAAGLARRSTGHVIVVPEMPVPLEMVAREMLDLLIVVPEMPARVTLVLRDGGRRDVMLVREMLVREMLVRHRVVVDQTGLARKVGMAVREVNAVPKGDRNTVREGLRLAVPDRSIVDRSPVRREVQKVDVWAKADAVMPGLGVNMVARHDGVMIVDVDSVVLRRSLDEVRLAARHHL